MAFVQVQTETVYPEAISKIVPNTNVEWVSNEEEKIALQANSQKPLKADGQCLIFALSFDSRIVQRLHNTVKILT